MKIRPTRYSSCGLLDLLLHIACPHYKKSMEKAKYKKLPQKRIKKCLQPWATKWAEYREIGKQKNYEDIQIYWDNLITNLTPTLIKCTEYP